MLSPGFRTEVLTAVNQSFAVYKIDMPFPTQVVLFHDQSEETDADDKVNGKAGMPVWETSRGHDGEPTLWAANGTPRDRQERTSSTSEAAAK